MYFCLPSVYPLEFCLPDFCSLEICWLGSCPHGNCQMGFCLLGLCLQVLCPPGFPLLGFCPLGFCPSPVHHTATQWWVWYSSFHTEAPCSAHRALPWGWSRACCVDEHELTHCDDWMEYHQNHQGSNSHYQHLWQNNVNKLFTLLVKCADHETKTLKHTHTKKNKTFMTPPPPPTHTHTPQKRNK